MKKSAVLVAFLFISIANAQNWDKEKIKGNGNPTTISRTTESYDEISVTGSFDVELVSGKEGNITINGDENIINHIITEVVGTKLKIHFEKNKSYSYNSKLIITVPFEEISKVSLNGSGDIETKDTVNAKKFEINLTGSGDGIFNVNSTNLNVSLSGSGDVKVIGITKDLDAKVAGSGAIDCSKLEAQNADVNVAGSGDLKVNCIKNLTASVVGSGDIHYKNKPETVDKKIVGSGDITSY
jgi:hypothetical protein